MYIEELYQRLVEVARRKVRAGEVTERRLARLSNLSQPHMHHVLKNMRTLSAASADRLMRALGVTVPELYWRYPTDAEGGVRAVPVMNARIGPGSEAVFTSFRGYAPFPASLIHGLSQPVAARLAADLVMPKFFLANDLVLLDQNPQLRQKPDSASFWVVADGSGLRVRHVKLAGPRLYLGSRTTGQDPRNWQSIALQGRNILDIVRARIVWLSREMEKAPSGPPYPAGAGN